jgi:hypothetical protein
LSDADTPQSAGAARGHTADAGAVAALVAGMRRVNRAPSILVGIWLMTVFTSLPLTFVLRDMIAQHLGSSLAADRAADGVDYDWMQEFAEQAGSVGATFRPTIIGFAAVLDNSSAFLDNTPRGVAVVSVAALYVILWLFVAGGILDRFARDRATRSYGFFGASGAFFFRFLRLGIVMVVVYGWLFQYVHPWLFDTVREHFSGEINQERTAFFFRLALYVVFGALVAACNLVLDYAKVRAVVEDRRSMLGALAAAVRFVGSNAGATVSLYLMDFALFLVAVLLYAAIAPGAGRAGWTTWLDLAIAQAYVTARLWVKLLFWASETALFQRGLAHSGYIAAPARVWPDSPAAEAIARL